MLHTSLKTYKLFQTKTFLKLKYINIQATRKLNSLPSNGVYSCICGQVYTRKPNQRRLEGVHSRVHSTQSDQHRQKVVIETSAPHVIDKLRLGKVLPIDKDVADKKLSWREKIDPYMKLARWDKPTGVYLLYWPCAWSIALATIPGNIPLSTSVQTAGLFLVGAGLMRGAGCTINDLWDRDIDAQVERTKDRPLVTGAVTVPQAMVFLAGQLTLALGVLLQLNCFSVLLGASSMLLVVTYPLAKRFTNYPQLFLGATFNWGALLGYSAVQGNLDLSVCIPLYFAAIAWTQMYDTIYAYQDKVDDARIGVKSTALTFGANGKRVLLGALGVQAACLAAAGHAAGLAAPAALALLAGTGIAARQIQTLNVDDPADCAAKFKANSIIGLIIFLGIVGGGYSRYRANSRDGRGLNLDASKSCFL